MIGVLRAMSMSSSSSDVKKRLEAVWNYIGVPQRLANATLENYRPGCKEQEQALHACREYVRRGPHNISRGKGLLFKGPVGTGKSHLSIATLRAVIEAHLDQFGRPPSRSQLYGQPEYAGYSCSMIPVFDLLERVRQTYRSRERQKEYVVDLIRRCRHDDVVIMDDIGAEKPSDWVEEQLYGLIDLRYRMQRTTFFTTNCSMLQLESQIGTRSVSRICEMCEGIMVGGDDWRKIHSGYE